jgi:hypothetical protein
VVVAVSNHKLRWGVRYKGSADEIDHAVSRAEAVRHMARVADGGEIVVQMVSPWMPEHVVAGVVDVNMPAVECRNCKGTDLGFEVATSTRGPEFYQGCNDCSETLWTGDWDLFHAVLAALYDIRIPRCE